VIPPKRNRKRRRGGPPGYDRALYRERNVVERVIGHLKEHRWVGMGQGKLAVTYWALMQVAFIKRYLYLLHPSKTA